MLRHVRMIVLEFRSVGAPPTVAAAVEAGCPAASLSQGRSTAATTSITASPITPKTIIGTRHEP